MDGGRARPRTWAATAAATSASCATGSRPSPADDESLLTSTLAASMESHLIGFTAEESRHEGGVLKVIPEAELPEVGAAVRARSEERLRGASPEEPAGPAWPAPAGAGPPGSTAPESAATAVPEAVVVRVGRRHRQPFSMLTGCVVRASATVFPRVTRPGSRRIPRPSPRDNIAIEICWRGARSPQRRSRSVLPGRAPPVRPDARPAPPSPRPSRTEGPATSFNAYSAWPTRQENETTDPASERRSNRVPSSTRTTADPTTSRRPTRGWGRSTRLRCAP